MLQCLWHCSPPHSHGWKPLPSLSLTLAPHAVLCDGSETDRTRPQNPKTALVRYRKDTVVEACTTLPFATVLDPIPNCNTKHGMLCGTAVRCMLGMCWLEITRAYAFGLYVDSAVLRMLSQRKYEWTPGDADTGKEALATSKGEPAPSLFLLDNKTRQPKVWGEVSLALRMAQTIDGPHMADGFKRSGKHVSVAARLPCDGI